MTIYLTNAGSATAVDVPAGVVTRITCEPKGASGAICIDTVNSVPAALTVIPLAKLMPVPGSAVTAVA